MNQVDINDINDIKQYHKNNIKMALKNKNFNAENLIKSLNFEIQRNRFNFYCTEMQLCIINFVKNYTKIINKLKKI